MRPKLQTLNHFDGKKDQFNFQTFIFDSFWDTVLKYCQILKKRKRPESGSLVHFSKTYLEKYLICEAKVIILDVHIFCGRGERLVDLRLQGEY